jgi:methyl-accepting chemotaxis protein
VADEVRKLADQAQRSAEEIAAAISAISTSMQKATIQIGDLQQAVSGARLTAGEFSCELANSATSANRFMTWQAQSRVVHTLWNHQCDSSPPLNGRGPM